MPAACESPSAAACQPADPQLRLVVWPSDSGGYDEARFFFNSDHSKDDLVYEMTVTEFKTVVDEVLYDEVVYMERIGTSGDFRQHNHAWREAQRSAKAARSPLA